MGNRGEGGLRGERGDGGVRWGKEKKEGGGREL